MKKKDGGYYKIFGLEWWEFCLLWFLVAAGIGLMFLALPDEPARVVNCINMTKEPFLFRIDYDSDMNLDFSDIRFTYPNGQTLDYVVLERVDGKYEKVLLLIDSVNSSARIDEYYGYKQITGNYPSDWKLLNIFRRQITVDCRGENRG